MKVSWDDDIPNIWNINLPKIYTQMLHVLYIYLQNWVIYGVNVGNYSIHGAYGIWTDMVYPLGN
jgi:hypothetical protein